MLGMSIIYVSGLLKLKVVLNDLKILSMIYKKALLK